MAIGYSNESDPRKLTANQRGLVQQRGDQLLQDQQNQASDAGNRADQTQDWLNSYLQPQVEGNGGYRADEAAKINNADQLDQYGLSPEQAAGNFLTPEEQAGIKGNTNYHANFDPNAMTSAQDASAGQQRGAVQGLKSGLKGAINPDALKQSGKFQQDSENQLNANQGQFGTVLGAVGDNVRGAIDPNAVNPSSEFLNKYDLTPEEQQDIVTGAGISAGAGYRASEGTIDRAARAAGASPMGVAAYRARSERDASSAGGDAMTQARIAASDAAAKRELTGEQLRENAGQYLTSTKTGAELQMGDQALKGTQALGDQALGQRNAVEGQRIGAEQYLTGANLNAATTGGEADIANEANLNAQGRQQSQFNAATGAGIAQAEDTANSNRAGAVATNRQNTGVQNQNTAYNQGLTKTTLGSTQAKTVADQRLGQQQGAIANYTGQQQQQNQNQQNAENRQVQTYGTQTSGTNDAAKTGVAASQTPGIFDKIVGGATGLLSAAGGVAGVKALADGGVSAAPGMNIVGDAGSEWIGSLDGSDNGQIVTSPTLALMDKGDAAVPLGYRAKAKTRPDMAMQAMKPRRGMYGEAA